MAEPRAAVVRDLIRQARTLGVAPTIYLGVRLPETTYLYEDADHPSRVTRTISSPAYVAEDRALLIGLELAEAAEDRHCRCGQPIEVAWHSDMDGYYERQDFVCHACTALAPDPQEGKKEPVVHSRVINTRPTDAPALAPFVLGVTTSAA